MNNRSQSDEVFAVEFANVCGALFNSRPTPSLDALAYWGRLRLFLGIPELAERTAAAMVSASDPIGRPDRKTDILVLKLLALSQSQFPIVPNIERKIAARYDALWMSHTPTHEQADRA